MSKCVKCGEFFVKKTYIPPRYFLGKTIKEYLSCKCRACGYTWKEDTLDGRS